VESLRVYNAWIAIRAQVKSTSLNDDRFFQFGEQNETPDRRLGCGDQKTVIPAGVAPVQGRRRKAPDAVSLEPLTAKGCIEIAAQIFSETDHLTLPNWPRHARLLIIMPHCV